MVCLRIQTLLLRVGGSTVVGGEEHEGVGVNAQVLQLL